jgi:Na+/proline symporter
MLTAWTVILVALAYVGVLFAIASYGDRAARRTSRGMPKPLIYALSLAVYCTSWAYFGSVGIAATSGYDFLPIYIGPILMLTVGWPVLRAIVDISRRQNITSIADFISARYGKNQLLGALVAVIAVIGVVPYISLQLKAVSFSLSTLISPGSDGAGSDLVLVVAIAMAAFAALFGTRHVDATEHQRGLILAIAVQSVVKLAAFLAVGIFATFWLMGGIGPLLDRVAAAPAIAEVFGGGLEGGRWVTMTLLAMCAIVLLPRQFHVAVVENTSVSDLKRAAWLFPLYLVAINLFVVPIAMAGLLTFGNRVDPDTFVLALPAAGDYRALTLVAFLGGLSAATAMVVMESVALSIMVCNNVVLPLLVRASGDLGRHVLLIRRAAIAGILVLAYSYYGMIGDSPVLAQSGLLSFAAVVQFAPAFFGGLLVAQGHGGRRHGGAAGGVQRVGLHAADAGVHRCRMVVRRGCSSMGCSASAPYARACCSTSTSIRSPTACCGACSSIPPSMSPSRSCASPRRSSGCRRAPSWRRKSRLPRRPCGCGARACRSASFRTRWRAISEASAPGAPSTSSPGAADRPSRRRKPTFAPCASPSTCWPAPSARPRRGWCWASCWSGAPETGPAPSRCSTMPPKPSSTAATSCSRPSTTCARASRCSTRTSI